MRSGAEAIKMWGPSPISEGIKSRRKDSLTNAFRNWWDSGLDPHDTIDGNTFTQVGMHLIGQASTPITYPFWALGGIGKVVMGAAHRDGYEVEEGLKMIVAPVISLATVVYGTATAVAKIATIPLRVAIGTEKK